MISRDGRLRIQHEIFKKQSVRLHLGWIPFLSTYTLFSFSFFLSFILIYVNLRDSHELARQLQAEEEHYHFARLERDQRLREEQYGPVDRQQLEERERRRREEANMQRMGRKKREKKEKECVVM